MTTPREDPSDDAGPLGSEVSAPAGDDDSMAGAVYPPPETEPDAHDVGRRPGLGRLLHRDD